MICTTNRILTLILILSAACKPDNHVTIKTEDRLEIVDGKNKVVEQIVQSLRKSDNKPIARLTKVFNYDNDIKIETLTGLTKDDGLQDYFLDSIYYDSKGNDTLTNSFVHLDNWYKTQLTKKKFRADNQIEHFITVRDIEGRPHFRKEILYKYFDDGRALSETEFECSQLVNCDSTFKKIFHYNLNGDKDSVMYIWTEKKWSEVNKNGR